MPPQIEVLFAFSAAQDRLVEIRQLDRRAGAPKAQVLLWLWVAGTTVGTLQFKAMTTAPTQQRIFEEGKLSFDDTGAEMTWTTGSMSSLAVESTRLRPSHLTTLIAQHVS